MDENRYSDYVLVAMKNLNLLTVLYISVMMASGLSGYIRENSALDYLTQISRMPIAAWKIPVIAIGLYLSCLLLLSIQNVSNSGFF